MDVSENSGTPKSYILIGFSIINHPFWGTSIFGNTQMDGFRLSITRFFFLSDLTGCRFGAYRRAMQYIHGLLKHTIQESHAFGESQGL